MKTSPFKVMTTAALSAAVAIPAATITADAAEVELQQVAFELDGEVQVVDFEDYVDAIVSESGDLYDYVTEASPAAIGIGEGEFVSYEALVNAIIDADEDQTGQEVLAEVSENEEALVEEDTVAEYGQWGEDTSAPAVESVSANNLKEVTVDFNKDVSDLEGVTNVDNYSLEDPNGNDVDLDAAAVNGSQVTLWLTDDQDNQDEVTLDVSSDLVEDSETFELEFFDTTVPTAEGVEVVGQNTLKVEFSEPIDPSTGNAKEAFELTDEDGTNYNVREANFDNNNRVAFVEFFSDLEDGEYTLTVNSEYQDYVPFTVKENEFTIDVVEDEDAPELVEASSLNQKTVVYEFDETVELTEGDGQVVDSGDFLDNFYHTNSKNTASKVEVKNGNEVHVTFGDDEVLPNGVANLYIDGESVTDLWGNEQVSQLTAEITTDYDSEAPSVDNVSQVDNSQNSFVLSFDSVVDGSTATNHDNYTVTNADGDELSIDTIEFDSEDSDNVEVTLNDPAYGSLTVEVLAIEDLFGNEMGDESVALEMVDVTAPDAGEFEGTFYKDSEDTVITFDFNDKMATSGDYAVNELSNYTVENSDGDDVALDSVSSASLEVKEDGSQIEIAFDTDDLDIKEDKPEFKGTRVADAEDNRINTLTFTEELDNISEGEVSYDSITIVDEDTVEVNFDQDLEIYDEQDFEFTANGNDVEIESSNQVEEDTVRFNLNTELDTEGHADGGDFLTLTTVAGGETVNRFGQGVDINQEIDPSVENITEELSPEVDSVVTTSQDTIEVTFTEEVEAALVNRTTFDVEDNAVTNVTATESADGYATTFELDLDESIELDDTPEVSVADASDIVDQYGNVFDGEVPSTEDGYTANTAISTPVSDEVVNASEDEELTVAGTAEPNSTIEISIDDDNADNDAVTSEVDVDSDGNYSTDLDVSSLDEGTLTVEVVSLDDSDNEIDSDSINVVKDTEGATLTDASNTQEAAETTFQAGETDDEITVTLQDEGENNLLGAYGNEISVELVNGDNSGGDTSATFTGSTLTVTLGEDTDGNVNATVSEVVTSINNVDGFDSTVSSDANEADDTAQVATSNFADGSDEVTVTFSEAYNSEDVDTDDATTDFTLGNVTFEGNVATPNATTATITVTSADAQVQGEDLSVKDGEITDEDGNDVSTTAVTVN